jgi:hypothetical protein
MSRHALSLSVLIVRIVMFAVTAGRSLVPDKDDAKDLFPRFVTNLRMAS